jgi:hypothetical protein
VVPGLSRVATLWNPGNSAIVFSWKETHDAARALGVTLQSQRALRVSDVPFGLAPALHQGYFDCEEKLQGRVTRVNTTNPHLLLR